MSGQESNLGADYGPDTPGTTTSGIDEAVSLGVPVKLTPGNFKITGEITPPANGPLIVHGTGKSLTTIAGLDPSTFGTIITQQTAGLSVFHITNPLQGFSLRDFAIVFKSGMSSTGHGVFFDVETYYADALPATVSASIMVEGFDIRSVYCFGNDTGHYFLRLSNFLNGYISDVGGNGGGFIEFFSYGNTLGAYLNSGNTKVTGFTQWNTLPGTTVDVLTLYTSAPDGVPSGMNFVYVDPIDLTINSAITGNALSFKTTGTASTVTSNLIHLVIGDMSAPSLTIYNCSVSNGILLADSSTLSANITVSGPGSLGTFNAPITLNLVAPPGQNAVISSLYTYFLKSAGGGTGTYVGAGSTVLRQYGTHTGQQNVLTPTLPVNPPVSGTVYTNGNNYDIEIYLPVTYSPTSTSASTLVPAVGAGSPPAALPTVSVPAGTALDGVTLTYRVRVPAGWNFQFTVTNGTIGTAVILPA
jgi:hypothetical protein